MVVGTRQWMPCATAQTWLQGYAPIPDLKSGDMVRVETLRGNWWLLPDTATIPEIQQLSQGIMVDIKKYLWNLEHIHACRVKTCYFYHTLTRM